MYGRHRLKWIDMDG